MWRILPVGLLLLVGAVGCGPKLYPVRGKVTLPDGTSLTEGLVVFESKDADKPITARGQIQADGHYELGTYRPGDGALPGTYRVLIAPKTDPNAADKKQPPPPFDSRFMAFKTSGLEFEVKAESNEYPIQLTKSTKAK
jgi:hypothetical protein